MANEDIELIVNPLDWDTTDQGYIPSDGSIIYYKNSDDTVFSVIGDGSSTVLALRSLSIAQALRDGSLPFEAISLRDGSIKDKIAPLITTFGQSGWVSILKTNTASSQPIDCDFQVIQEGNSRNSSYKGHVDFCGSGILRTTQNTTIDILGRATSNASFGGVGNGLRMCCGDANNSGAVIQAYVDVRDGFDCSIRASVLNNLGISTGFELIGTPIMEDIPVLPDGTPATTFIEAGAEFTITPSGGFYCPAIAAQRGSDDYVRIAVSASFVWKNGNNVAITLPDNELRVRDGEGNTAIITNSHSTASLMILDDNMIYFNLVQVGAFTSLNYGPCSLQIIGSGFKLTITD